MPSKKEQKLATTKLSSWGTGQGFHVSRQAMEASGIRLGDECDIEYHPGVIVFRFKGSEHRRVKRTKLTFDEAFKNWNGGRLDAGDPWAGLASRGAEEDVWGC